MPNWCENIATIVAPNEIAAQRLFDAFTRGETCHAFLPVPADDPEWYVNRNSLWGVKWDFGADETNVGDINGTTVSVRFLSPWGPPLAFWYHLESLGYEVEATWYEPNMVFGGWLSAGAHQEVSLDVPSLHDIAPRLREVFGDDEFSWLFDHSGEEDAA